MTRSAPSSPSGASGGQLSAGRSEGWATNTSRSGANRAISCCQLAISEAGTTSRLGRRGPASPERARRPRPPRASPEEQTEHLDRLAQPHVVGQAGAQAEAREEPEPADPDRLVGAERGPEGLGIRRGQPLRACAGARGSSRATPRRPPGTNRPRRPAPRPALPLRSPSRPGGASPPGRRGPRAPRAAPAPSGRGPRGASPGRAPPTCPRTRASPSAPARISRHSASEMGSPSSVSATEKSSSASSPRVAGGLPPDGDADLEPPRPARVSTSRARGR